MKNTALIMAGGRGERFWPRSRVKLPKQFISLSGDGKTMIQLTVARIRSFVAPEDIFISTGTMYRDLVKEQLPEIPEENILCEPVGRNTAPCVALGAAHIRKKYRDAVMIVLPADHIIKYTALFTQVLKDASAVAEKGENLLTIGITPTYPETGYGYIQFQNGKGKGKGGAYPVERFVEKPDFETAQQYLASEQYLWNSGMFVWKASTILKNMERLMPGLYEGISRIEAAIGRPGEQEALEEEFIKFEPQSIDYGIMEKAENIYTIPGTFGWDDVGSWLAIERIQKTNEFGNAVTGNVITADTVNSTIQGGEKLIAAVGLRDIVIVDTEDALLVCQKRSAGSIKKVLDTLRMCGKEEYI